MQHPYDLLPQSGEESYLRRQISIATSFDQTKAIDWVPHRRIPANRESCGIMDSSFSRFLPYLKLSKQMIRWNRTHSTLLESSKLVRWSSAFPLQTAQCSVPVGGRCKIVYIFRPSILQATNNSIAHDSPSINYGWTNWSVSLPAIKSNALECKCHVLQGSLKIKWLAMSVIPLVRDLGLSYLYAPKFSHNAVNQFTNSKNWWSKPPNPFWE